MAQKHDCDTGAVPLYACMYDKAKYTGGHKTHISGRKVRYIFHFSKHDI